MRAVVTVIGKDRGGIIAGMSGVLYEHGVNILDIQQNVLTGGLFTMVMLVDITGCTVDFSDLVGILDQKGQELGMKVHTMHEDIFDAMHRI